eukprot:Polyplicarium_translucidae@DN3366_c2_g1_i11.p1
MALGHDAWHWDTMHGIGTRCMALGHDAPRLDCCPRSDVARFFRSDGAKQTFIWWLGLLTITNLAYESVAALSSTRLFIALTNGTAPFLSLSPSEAEGNFFLPFSGICDSVALA